jgi:hypothetical protein
MVYKIYLPEKLRGVEIVNFGKVLEVGLTAKHLSLEYEYER